MKQFFIRFLRLIIGLFLYALGIVTTLNARIGYAPWDVFHAGLAKTMGISIGAASILVGGVILIIAVLLGEKIGLGTVSNMVIVGAFVDMILGSNIIPVASGLAVGVVMLITGLFIISLATYFYIGTAFGAGPRDSLMVALTRKTKLPVGASRGAIEFLAALVGWILGGMLGLGTVISVLASGFCIQITFKLLKFDPTEVKHETMDHLYTALAVKLAGNKKELPVEQDA